jgi:hypothetical protein
MARCFIEVKTSETARICSLGSCTAPKEERKTFDTSMIAGHTHASS